MEYPTWESLPDTLKYSNVRQAKTISEKLSRINCFVKEIEGVEEYILSEKDIERLAEIEHILWMEERVETGWRYGVLKDLEKKTSPYLIPYEELPEEVKELDRDAIRNIPILLKKIGMCVVKEN